MNCCNLQQQQQVRQSRSESVQINFLTPKPDSLPTLNQQHFQPERIFSWTARLSIQLSRQLAFSKAIDTARRRLGLGPDCAFYFNCLPEHAQVSGLQPLEVAPTNTPAQEGLPAGCQVYVFVSSSRAATRRPNDVDQDCAEGLQTQTEQDADEETKEAESAASFTASEPST